MASPCAKKSKKPDRDLHRADDEAEQRANNGIRDHIENTQNLVLR